MPIATQCECGKAFRVKDELAGRKVRCPACKTVLVVPKPKVEKSAEEEAVDFLMTESPPVKAPVRKKPRDEDDEPVREEPEARITSKPPRPVRRSDDDEPRPRREKRERRERDESPRRSWGFVVSPTIITGLLMMLGAAVWFCLGLILIDTIFFYPPILFCLGIGAIFRGVTGQED